jgi:hypothetical protein
VTAQNSLYKQISMHVMEVKKSGVMITSLFLKLLTVKTDLINSISHNVAVYKNVYWLALLRMS